MPKPIASFFCDNCSAPRPSSKHTIRISKDGIETVSDTCEFCGVTQDIESTGEKTIRTRRFHNNG